MSCIAKLLELKRDNEGLKVIETIPLLHKGKIRTNDYITQHCKNLIDQIVTMGEKE